MYTSTRRLASPWSQEMSQFKWDSPNSRVFTQQRYAAVFCSSRRNWVQALRVSSSWRIWISGTQKDASRYSSKYTLSNSNWIWESVTFGFLTFTLNTYLTSTVLDQKKSCDPVVLESIGNRRTRAKRLINDSKTTGGLRKIWTGSRDNIRTVKVVFCRHACLWCQEQRLAAQQVNQWKRESLKDR